MKKFYKIDAVHPMAKRVIKSNLNEKQMIKLYKDLQNAGYEDKDIILETVKEIYEEGDSIIITKEMFDALPEEKNYIDRDKDGWNKLSKKAEAKNSIRYIFGENPHFPVTGTLEKNRIDRQRELLVVKWHNVPATNETNKINIYFLEYMGFEFKQPESKVIPISECPDDLLYTTELVIKYMMLENNWSEKAVETYLKPVREAMNKTGIVFYRP